MAEATYRYQFQHNASAQQSRAGVYCLGYGLVPNSVREPADPPPGFLKRLVDVTPPVKPYSTCSTSMDKGVKDNATGKRGLIFKLTGVQCEEASKCQIKGGYYEAGLSSSGNTYFLEKHDGRWIVVGSNEDWIS